MKSHKLPSSFTAIFYYSYRSSSIDPNVFQGLYINYVHTTGAR